MSGHRRRRPFKPGLAESDSFLFRQSEPTLDSSLGYIPEELESSDISGNMEEDCLPNGNHGNVTMDDESCGAHDGMLNNENEALHDRVISLEKKVQNQEDEIVCLKSALSDAIRRLQILESGRAQNSLLPSKPRVGGTASPRRSGPLHARDSPSSRRAMSSEGLSQNRYSSPTPNRIVPRASPSPGSTPSTATSKRWPSSPVMNTDSNGNMSPNSPKSPKLPMSPTTNFSNVRRSTSLCSLMTTGRQSPAPTHPIHHIRFREPVFNHEDKCLRFYLRGRSLNFYAPSSTEDYQASKPLPAPDEKLKLEWVYGYRGRDARSNLYLLPTGEMVYFVAAVVVLYNVEEQMQRHYLGHTDDVKSIAIHPDRLRIATGQVAGHDKREGRRKNVELLENPENWPHIRIWNSVNLQTLKIIGIGDFDRAVACIGFSKLDGGQYLVAVDEANEHVVSLWDWEKGQKITETKSSTEPVLVSEFHPCERNIIMTCGKGQISFWTIEGSTLTRKLGIYDRYDKPRFVTCLAFADNGDVLSGDSNGNFYVWGRGTNKITYANSGAHDGGLFSICVMKDSTILTGGKDRKIIQWTSAYKKTGLEHELPDQYGPIRMLSQGRGNMVLVGTTKNTILQGSLDLKFSAIVQGHTDELWGLATHPNQHQFVTCGYDRTMFLWDTLTHTTIWCKELPDGAHCACLSPDGSMVLVGTVCGRWLAIEMTSRDVITTHTDGSETLACMAFSPDGSLLAVGSRDNIIYVYTVSENNRKYTRAGKCTGHSSYVTHIDWSADSQCLQSNSGDYELLFWNATTCRQITSPSSMRDVEWATQSCTLSFSTCGMWPEGADGTDINACSSSRKRHLLASADDFGKVNLLTYPSSQPKSVAHIYGGHSSHVTNIDFLHDDSRLISTGGKDTAIFQWELLG